jgi:hypothetical protein
MEIVRSYTPLVEPIALDEAFLDVQGARRLHGSGPEVAAEIRRRVREETGLTASVGVATTKLLAKLASDLAKPDGLLVVEPGTELAFLHPLDVGRLWGVGPATRRRLAQLGVQTVGDLAAVPEDALVAKLGKAAGHSFHARAWNRDDRGVEPDHEVKSIGHEETFPTDVYDRAALEHEIVRLAVPARWPSRPTWGPTWPASRVGCSTAWRSTRASGCSGSRASSSWHRRPRPRGSRPASSTSRRRRPPWRGRATAAGRRSSVRWTRCGPGSALARWAPVYRIPCTGKGLAQRDVEPAR